MLGEAMNRMRDGVKSFEKGDPITGRAQGEAAYGILNKVVVELNRSSSSSCSKPGGGQGAQQRMQDLMGRQQQLNDMTRQLQQQIPNPQNLSPEQRAQMGRLLGEQQSIQQQLQDIERQAREQRELLGRMDKLQDEMHEVVQDMESQQLDEETLRVQEKIVSRMLDAQRSLHKRDFNEERQSRTGEEIYSKGGKMPADADKLKKLHRDIDRALRDGTPEEYQDLVREYFRAISEAPAAPQSGQVP
jgi:chromosome segregation ATPase